MYFVLVLIKLHNLQANTDILMLVVERSKCGSIQIMILLLDNAAFDELLTSKNSIASLTCTTSWLQFKS